MKKDFQNLKELMEAIGNFKSDRIEIFNKTQANSKFGSFYNELRKGNIDSEESAIKVLYEGKKGQRKNFLKLKNRFRERLLNTVLFVDLSNPKFQNYNKAFYRGNKNFAIIKVLKGRGAHGAAQELAEKTFRMIREFDYTDLNFLLANILKQHYALFEPNQKKYNMFRDEEKLFLEILQAEVMAKEFYFELAMPFTKSKASKPELVNLAETYCSRLAPFMEKIQTVDFIDNAYGVYFMRYAIDNDIANANRICDRALNLMEKKPFIHRGIIPFFAANLTSGLVKLKKYEEALKTVKKYEKILGSPVYMTTLYMAQFMLFVHTERYDEALELHWKVTQHPSFKTKSRQTHETWKLYEAYLFLFFKVGKYKNKEKASSYIGNFKYGKFFNEVPAFSKDKSGVNVSILVFQVLMFLSQKNYNKFIDYVDALARYSSRYLKKDETYRSNCFIKMLLTLPEADFHKVAVIRKAEKLVKRLEEMPLEIAPQSSELEIVPYEMLWESALELLE